MNYNMYKDLEIFDRVKELGWSDYHISLVLDITKRELIEKIHNNCLDSREKQLLLYIAENDIDFGDFRKKSIIKSIIEDIRIPALETTEVLNG